MRTTLKLLLGLLIGCHPKYTSEMELENELPQIKQEIE